MNILLQQNSEIKEQLLITNDLIKEKELNQNIIHKIKIINDKLLEISQTLTKLNIDIKLDNNILLNNDEKQYLKDDQKSNEYIAKILPALTLFCLNDKTF